MKIKPGNIGHRRSLQAIVEGRQRGARRRVYIVKGGEYDSARSTPSTCSTASRQGTRRPAKSRVRCCGRSTKRFTPSIRTTTHRKRSRAGPVHRLPTFNGATFLAELGIERGGQKPDGGSWPDKNVIARCCASVTRATESSTSRRRRRSSVRRRPPQPRPRTNGAPAVAPTAIAKPDWAAVTMARHKIGAPTPEKIDDMWQRRATAACHRRGARTRLPVELFHRRRRSRD